MEFGKHIGKGFWGFADKSLVVVYGLGFIFLVLRVLPEEEYGAFVMIQAIFNLIVAFAGSFALQPLVKFGSESDDLGSILAPGLFLYAAFLLLSSFIVSLGAPWIAGFVAPSYSQHLAELLMYLPALLIAAFVRNVAIALLQTRFRIREIFAVDAIFFLGSLLLLFVAHESSMLTTAYDLIVITFFALIASSVSAIVIAFDLLKHYRRITRDDMSRIWGFGKYSLVSSASVAVQAQLDVFFLSAFGGSVQVAVFSAAKIFVRIFDVMNQVIQLFVVPASSRFFSKGDHSSLQSMMEKSICFSTLFLLPVFLIFAFGAEFILELFYADRYADANIPLRIFAFLAAVVPASSVLSSILVGLGRVKTGMILTWIFLACSFILQWLLVPRFGPTGAALANVGAMTVLTVGASIAVNRILPVRVMSILARTRDLTTFIRKRMRNGA